MFVAFKVGVTAFKAGKIAANAKETFGALHHQISLWEAQLQFYSDFFERVHDVIPATLYSLCQARVKVAHTYLTKLNAQISRAEAGEKKAKAMLIGKSSGEMGTTFEHDITSFWVMLNEAHQFCDSHLNYTQFKQMESLSKQLQALGQPGLQMEHKKYHSEAMSEAVLSKKFIFAVEFPMGKVIVGDAVPIKWVIAGEIPHVMIEVQVSSITQIAQDRKKKWIMVAEQVENTYINGEYTWTIPLGFAKEYSQHGNYSFRITYQPKGESESSRIRAHTDTFKIKDPSIPKSANMSKATNAFKNVSLPFGKKEKEGSPAASPAPTHGSSSPAVSSPAPSHSTGSPATATPTYAASSPAPHQTSSLSPSTDKEKDKGGVGGALGKAGGFLKKKF